MLSIVFIIGIATHQVPIFHEQVKSEPIGKVLGIQDQNQDVNHPQETYFGANHLKSSTAMLQASNVAVFPEDKITAFPEPSMGLGSVITVSRALPVHIRDGSQVQTVRTWQTDVKTLLTEQRIDLGQKDMVQPALSSSLSKNLDVIITRVAETDIKEALSVPYETVKNNDANLEKGLEKIVQTGTDGTREKVWHIRRENGREISRVLKSDKIVLKPKSKIIAIGTKIISYGTGVASYYIKTSQMIAACNFLPRGTKVKVVNLYNGKEVVVTIVGGGMRSDRIIDLSTGAFQALGASLGQGLIRRVRLEKVYD